MKSRNEMVCKTLIEVFQGDKTQLQKWLLSNYGDSITVHLGDANSTDFNGYCERAATYLVKRGLIDQHFQESVCRNFPPSEVEIIRRRLSPLVSGGLRGRSLLIAAFFLVVFSGIASVYIIWQHMKVRDPVEKDGTYIYGSYKVPGFTNEIRRTSLFQDFNGTMSVARLWADPQFSKSSISANIVSHGKLTVLFNRQGWGTDVTLFPRERTLVRPVDEWDNPAKLLKIKMSPFQGPDLASFRLRIIDVRENQWIWGSSTVLELKYRDEDSFGSKLVVDRERNFCFDISSHDGWALFDADGSIVKPVYDGPFEFILGVVIEPGSASEITEKQKEWEKLISERVARPYQRNLAWTPDGIDRQGLEINDITFGGSSCK